MKDMEAHLEKLRRDAAECAIIRDLATDPKKRDLFTKLGRTYVRARFGRRTRNSKRPIRPPQLARLQVTANPNDPPRLR